LDTAPSSIPLATPNSAKSDLKIFGAPDVSYPRPLTTFGRPLIPQIREGVTSKQCGAGGYYCPIVEELIEEC
jgi:hypothetical protein